MKKIIPCLVALFVVQTLGAKEVSEFMKCKNQEAALVRSSHQEVDRSVAEGKISEVRGEIEKRFQTLTHRILASNICYMLLVKNEKVTEPEEKEFCEKMIPSQNDYLFVLEHLLIREDFSAEQDPSVLVFASYYATEYSKLIQDMISYCPVPTNRK